MTSWLLKFLCVSVQLLQSCLTLCNSMDHSLPGSSVYGIFQTRVLEWLAMPFSRDQTLISCASSALQVDSLWLSHLGELLKASTHISLTKAGHISISKLSKTGMYSPPQEGAVAILNNNIINYTNIVTLFSGAYGNYNVQTSPLSNPHQCYSF